MTYAIISVQLTLFAVIILLGQRRIERGLADLRTMTLGRVRPVPRDETPPSVVLEEWDEHRHRTKLSDAPAQLAKASEPYDEIGFDFDEGNTR